MANGNNGNNNNKQVKKPAVGNKQVKTPVAGNKGNAQAKKPVTYVFFRTHIANLQFLRETGAHFQARKESEKAIVVLGPTWLQERLLGAGKQFTHMFPVTKEAAEKQLMFK